MRAYGLKIVAFLAAISVLLLAGCAPSAASVGTAIAQTESASATGTAAFVAVHGACAVDAVLKNAVVLQDLLTRWDDAANIAGSTGRGNLAAPVAKLQDLRREATTLVVPTCLEQAKAFLVLGMDNTVTGYLDFMQQKDDSLVQSQFADAGSALAKFAAELQRVRKCAPDCGGVGASATP